LYQHYIVNETKSYYSCTLQKSESLIVGLSRARRAISPDILEEKLSLSSTIQNLAIDLNTSPFGKSYNDFILNKLKHSKSKKGIFIISVSPLSVMNRKREIVINKLRETDYFIYNLLNVNSNPNFEFLLKYPIDQKKMIGNIINDESVNKKLEPTIRHENGWHETIIDDNDFFDRNPVPTNFIFSEDREKHLENLIQNLSNIGNVYLVRLPMSNKTYRMENEIYPDFDLLINNFSEQYNCPYFNYSKNHTGYHFYDARSHMSGKSAVKFTKRLAKDILNYRTDE